MTCSLLPTELLGRSSMLLASFLELSPWTCKIHDRRNGRLQQAMTDHRGGLTRFQFYKSSARPKLACFTLHTNFGSVSSDRVC